MATLNWILSFVYQASCTTPKFPVVKNLQMQERHHCLGPIYVMLVIIINNYSSLTYICSAWFLNDKTSPYLYMFLSLDFLLLVPNNYPHPFLFHDYYYLLQRLGHITMHTNLIPVLTGLILQCFSNKTFY